MINFNDTYKSNKLFEHIKDAYELETDQDLAKFLHSSPSTISRINNDTLGLTPKMTLVVYDRTGLPIEQIRSWFKQKVKRKDPDV
jgi:hypothetical protein